MSFILGRSKRRISLDLKSRPDAPVDLRVSNVTHNAAYLTWTPGFHGGMEQYFRIKYNPLLDRGDVRHFDVYPADKNNARLPDLEPGTSYEMSIMSFNNLGESNYTDEAAVVTTSSEYPQLSDTSVGVKIAPRLVSVWSLMEWGGGVWFVRREG